MKNSLQNVLIPLCLATYENIFYLSVLTLDIFQLYCTGVGPAPAAVVNNANNNHGTGTNSGATERSTM